MAVPITWGWRLLEFLVNMFCLAVRLEMICGGGVELHIEEAVELSGKFCNKLWAPAGYIHIREPMEFLDILLV